MRTLELSSFENYVLLSETHIKNKSLQGNIFWYRVKKDNSWGWLPFISCARCGIQTQLDEFTPYPKLLNTKREQACGYIKINSTWRCNICCAYEGEI